MNHGLVGVGFTCLVSSTLPLLLRGELARMETATLAERCFSSAVLHKSWDLACTQFMQCSAFKLTNFCTGWLIPVFRFGPTAVHACTDFVHACRCLGCSPDP